MKQTEPYAFGPMAFPAAAAPTMPPPASAVSPPPRKARRSSVGSMAPPPPLVSPPPPIASQPPATLQDAPVIKIVDWTAVGYAAFELVFCLFVGVLAIGPVPLFAAVLLPGALVALVVLVQKSIGVTFDPGRSTLRFYAFFLPREVALADIHDANCQFAITVSPSRLAIAFCAGGGGGKGRRGGGSATQRTYMVNLSGAFGSRQLRFYSKRWRDTFLSILRDQAPACRITRWY